MTPRKSSDQATFGESRRKRLKYMPGQVIVRVHPEAVRPHIGAPRRPRGRAAFRATAELGGAVPDSVGEPLKYLRENAGLRNIRPLLSEAGRAQVQRMDVAPAQKGRVAIAAAVAAEDEDALAGLAICDVDPKVKAATLRHAEQANAVDFIEQVPARWLAAEGPDPSLNVQWGLRAINWFAADRPDASAVTVAVLDTGIDAGHPDFARVKIEYHHPRTRATDIVGHGTHVAGIVAAGTNNAVGIAGVAACALDVWKVFGDEPIDDEYYVDPDLMADALRACSDSGATAVNLSLGGTESSRTEQLLIRRLLDRGVAVVAAMGNEFEDGNPTSYPAAYDDVLAVGSIAETRERSSFSNTGTHIGICAPGSNILSTVPRRRSVARDETMYASWSGTSMATPHVSAAAALVRADRPELGATAIAKHLRDTAVTLPAMGRRRRTNEFGDGLLDLRKALS